MAHGQESFVVAKGDADKALFIIEAEITQGTWTDPERTKVTLGDYAATWISQRPKLRPRTIDQYRWLLSKRIAPHLGSVPGRQAFHADDPAMAGDITR